MNFESYLGTARVIDRVSFDIPKNSWFGLAGESGCGKSVTAYTILKLLPKSAKTIGGQVLFKGRDLLKYSEKQIRGIRGREISIVFQEAQTALNPSMRIGDSIVETLRYRDKVCRRKAKEVAVELLDKVRIPNPEIRFRQYPHELSGGMQQRVCIALALACNPSLLIADEFTTSLDVTIQEEILNLVIDLQKEFALSVLFITHDLALIAQFCDFVVIMYAGQIMEKGRVSSVLANPLHPYTQALLRAIPTLTNEERHLQSINGFVPSLIDPPAGCRFHSRCKHKIAGVCDVSFPSENEINKEHMVYCHLNLKE